MIGFMASPILIRAEARAKLPFTITWKAVVLAIPLTRAINSSLTLII